MNAYEFMIPCRYCGRTTLMSGTKLCDPCYEMKNRIQANPEVAARMLKEIGK